MHSQSIGINPVQFSSKILNVIQNYTGEREHRIMIVPSKATMETTSDQDILSSSVYKSVSVTIFTVLSKILPISLRRFQVFKPDELLGKFSLCKKMLNPKQFLHVFINANMGVRKLYMTQMEGKANYFQYLLLKRYVMEYLDRIDEVYRGLLGMLF